MNSPCRFTPRHILHAVLLWLICFSALPLHASAQSHAAPAEARTGAVPAAQPSFEQLVQQLPGGSLRDRTATVNQLSSQRDERLADIFNALLAGDLLADKDTPPTIAIRSGNQLTDALNGTALSDSQGLRRIPVNNSLRTQLRGEVAQLNLNHPDTDKRYAAVQRFIRDGVDADTAALLRAHQELEESGRVQGAISTALAVYRLQSDDSGIRQGAIDELSGSLEQEARNALREIAANDADPELRAAAAEAIESIQGRISFYRFVENLFFGLSLGSVLLLAAIGLAITFGVMGVINMAHGELIMIGAYTTWGVQVLFPNLIEWSLLIAIPAAFLITALVGIAIERGVIRFLYGRPLETLLATFGLSLVLQQAVRTLFSPLNRSVSSPEWISGTLTINPVLSITYTRLYILIFGLLVFFALMLVMKRTALGLKVRAVSQNRAMARAVGVRSSWVDALTFGLGSGIAGVAGVALSQLTNVGPNLGQAYIIDSFMVVVFGGVGNLWGTLVSAMSLGLINNFLEPYAGAMLAKVLVLIMLILFIQKKPKGLFPQKGRAAAD